MLLTLSPKSAAAPPQSSAGRETGILTRDSLLNNLTLQVLW